MDLVDRTELAWAAGFWDGEGWANRVRFGRGDETRPMARINQADSDGVPAVLLRFQAAVGVGDIHGPELIEGREPIYRWVASSRDEVWRTGSLLVPWLGVVKRAQFEAIRATLGAGRDWANVPLEERRAWAAGLWDAEGCVCLLKHRTHAGHFQPEASLTQSSDIGRPEVLERLFGVVGRGYFYGPFAQEGSPMRVYRWKLFRPSEIRELMQMLSPWLGVVKRKQFERVFSVLEGQPSLPRGNPAWGSHKTHCVRGHEYATARLRPFRSRGKNADPQRASHQCLRCVRDDARAKRIAKKMKNGG